jgi:general secretion pathway protein J
MMRGYARTEGFTLLELVVAIAIFAAMYVMAQQFLSAALRNREILNRHADALESGQRTLIFLTMDMEQTIARPVRDRFGDTRPAVEGGESRVSLTRLGWANPMDLRHRSTMQRVTWRLRDDQLIRAHYQVLDRAAGAEPRQAVLMDDVSDFQVRYLHETGAGESEWIRRWPPEDTAGSRVLRQPLPQSVEITVKREQGTGLHRFFRLVENPWS